MIRSCALVVAVVAASVAAWPAAATETAMASGSRSLPAAGEPSGLKPDEVRDYAVAMLRCVRRDQAYPERALDNGWQGTVRINVTIGTDGRVKAADLRQSSGHRVLDEEALRKVHRLQGLPAPPPLLRGREFRIAIPVRFVIGDHVADSGP